RLVDSLSDLRGLVASRDRPSLLEVLERARKARRNLPARLPRPEDMVEVRVPVPDRPGVLAEVTTLAGELGVNIEDMEIAHSAEGERGVLALVIDARAADLVSQALSSRGYRPAVRPLE
ncbi:MAG: ACT domain-containing protein, partial [Acidimicrobiales bacterium]